MEITCSAKGRSSISTVQCSFDRDIRQNKTSFRIEFFLEDCNYEKSISLLKCDWVYSNISCSKNLGNITSVSNWTSIEFSFNNSAINTLTGHYMCSLLYVPHVTTKSCREYEIHHLVPDTKDTKDKKCTKCTGECLAVLPLALLCSALLIAGVVLSVGLARKQKTKINCKSFIEKVWNTKRDGVNCLRVLKGKSKERRHCHDQDLDDVDLDTAAQRSDKEIPEPSVRDADLHKHLQEELSNLVSLKKHILRVPVEVTTWQGKPLRQAAPPRGLLLEIPDDSSFPTAGELVEEWLRQGEEAETRLKDYNLKLRNHACLWRPDEGAAEVRTLCLKSVPHASMSESDSISIR